MGFFIGLAIFLAFELFKKAWLVVHFAPKEEIIIALGSQPISLGSSEEAHIYQPASQGFAAKTATISLNKGQIWFHNLTSGQTQQLKNGSKLQIGTLEIEVKTA